MTGVGAHAAEPALPPFRVLSQTRIPDVSDPSGNGDIWRVDFTTPSGVSSYILVTHDSYNASYVAGELTKQAEEIEAVSRLGAQ